MRLQRFRQLLILPAILAILTGCEGLSGGQTIITGLGMAEGAVGALSRVALPHVSDDRLEDIVRISGEGAAIAESIGTTLREVNTEAVAEQAGRPVPAP